MFKKIAYYYKKGIYKKEHLNLFLNKGIINKFQYFELLNNESEDNANE